MGVSGSWERAARGAMLLGADGQLRPTIFGEMSALAASTGAINLGQGFPDEDGPIEVLDAARRAIADGLNQYPPALGMPVLREAIAAHQQRFYGVAVDADRQVKTERHIAGRKVAAKADELVPHRQLRFPME